MKTVKIISLKKLKKITKFDVKDCTFIHESSSIQFPMKMVIELCSKTVEVTKLGKYQGDIGWSVASWMINRKISLEMAEELYQAGYAVDFKDRTDGTWGRCLGGSPKLFGVKFKFRIGVRNTEFKDKDYTDSNNLAKDFKEAKWYLED